MSDLADGFGWAVMRSEQKLRKHFRHPRKAALSVNGNTVLCLNSFQKRQKGADQSSHMCRALAAKRRRTSWGHGSSFGHNTIVAGSE